MNNVLNDNRLGADFTAFMQRLSSGQGVDGEVTIKSEKTDSGVTLTVTHTGSGNPVVNTYELPELSEAKLQDKFPVMAALKSLADKVPPETFQQLQSAFGQFCRESGKVFASGGTPPTNDTHTQTMFDIYDLLRLLQDVGQTLKNTARESREAALQSDMALIRSEAEIQRVAAIDGFILTAAISIGMCAFTIGFSAFGIRSSSKAYKLEKKAQPTAKTAATEAQAVSKETAVKKDEQVGKSEKEENVGGKKAQEEKNANASGKGSKTQSKDNTEKVQEKRKEDIKDKEEDEQIIEDENSSKQNEQNLKAEKNEVKDKGIENKQDAKADKEKAVDDEQEQVLKKEDEQQELTDEEKDELFAATQSSQKLQLYAQLSMMAGQGLAGLGQSVQQIMSAQGTLLEADQRKAEALRDELTEIMQDAQGVISAVKDLRESIIQSESQTIDTILRA